MSDVRRRLDVVLETGFVAGLGELPTEEVRARIQAARQEEEDHSYYRRMLHARIDALRAGSKEEAVDKASRAGGGGGRGARPRVLPNAANSPGRRDVEKLLSEPFLAKVGELGPEELAHALGRLEAEEKRVSGVRRALHEVLDALESELAERYKRGLEPSLDRLQ